VNPLSPFQPQGVDMRLLILAPFATVLLPRGCYICGHLQLLLLLLTCAAAVAAV